MSAQNRRWFQIHLSTVIILSFVLGILLYLNLRKDQIIVETKPSSLFRYFRSETMFGFPMVAYKVSESWAERSPGKGERENIESQLQWVKSAIVVNIASIGIILLAVAMLFEFYLRNNIGFLNTAKRHAVTIITANCILAILWLANTTPRRATLPTTGVRVDLLGWPFPTKAEIAFDDLANIEAFAKLDAVYGRDSVFRVVEDVDRYASHANKSWNIGVTALIIFLFIGVVELVFFYRRAYS